MKAITILVPMKLHGQERSGPGYAMVALLIALSIMAVMMTAVMPVWKQTAQREKEEELVFRGQQYVHAIALFQRKYANTSPPNLNVLVEQRFLRKKFKDPITNDDFEVLSAGQAAAGAPSNPGRQGGATAGRGVPGSTTPSQTASAGGASGGRGTSTIGSPGAGGTTAGISGVASKSKDKSIRLYNGRSHYNEWAFLYVPPIQTPGPSAPTGAPGLPQRGQRGQPGQPGQPGQNPFGGPGGFGGRGPGGAPGGRGPGAPGGRGGFGPGVVPPVQPTTPGTPRGRSGD